MTLIQRTLVGTICVLLFAFALLLACGFLYLLAQGHISLAMFCFVASGLLAGLTHRGVTLITESVTTY